MSFTAACGWTLLRSLLIAVLALPVMSRLRDWLVASRERTRRLLWVALLVIFFTPTLLVGYAYSNFSLSFVHFPVGNELLYSLLLFFKLVPLGAAVLYFSPEAPVSPEALFCAKLAQRGASDNRKRLPARLAECWRLRGFWMRGQFRSAFPALAVIFLLAFQEFEMASLMGVTTGLIHTPISWSVHLYDAQVGGLVLADSLKLVLLPLACEFVVLLPLLVALLASHREAGSEVQSNRPIKSRHRIVDASVLGIAGVVVCGLPLALVLHGSWQGVSVLLTHLRFSKEILSSVLYALVCGTSAYAVAAWFIAARGNRLVGFVMALPGLTGTLFLGLVTLALFQYSWLNRAYDTALPFLLAMIVFLLPRALLLQILLHGNRAQAGRHLATVLSESSERIQRDSGQQLIWQTQFRGHFWGVVFVCYWAYWDLTLASLLLPPGMAAAPLRLYNLMHYGQSAVHSAMLLASIVIPVLIVLILAAVRRPLLRWLLR